MGNIVNKNLFLTFDDVQLLPQFSKINSRNVCSLSTRLTKQYTINIPILASPMDTICDSRMAISMMDLGGAGIVHRFLSIEDQCEEINTIVIHREKNYKQEEWHNKPIIAAIGITGDYVERATYLAESGVDIILLDVAHGHHSLMEDALHILKNSIKNIYPGIDIIAGNVATAEAAEDLCNWGADALRCGIGGGCFTPDMEVRTESGNKKISEITTKDRVYTHTGELKPVTGIISYNKEEELSVINGIECTKNHQFYVVHKKYKNEITEENIKEFAIWLAAGDLTDDYLLINLE
jgi:IMP dehydrogenase